MGATAPHGSYFCEDDPGFVEGLVDSSVSCAALVLRLDFFFCDRFQIDICHEK